MSERITMTCAACGSEDVFLDADAVWSVQAQEWELKCTYDNAQCAACGGETTLVELLASDVRDASHGETQTP